MLHWYDMNEVQRTWLLPNRLNIDSWHLFTVHVQMLEVNDLKQNKMNQSSPGCAIFRLLPLTVVHILSAL